MALVAEFTCLVCNEPRYEVVVPSRICAECRGKEADRARRIYFASLTGLTLEERVARIEKQLYDQDLDRRLKAVEVANVRY